MKQSLHGGVGAASNLLKFLSMTMKEAHYRRPLAHERHPIFKQKNTIIFMIPDEQKNMTISNKEKTLRTLCLQRTGLYLHLVILVGERGRWVMGSEMRKRTALCNL